MIYKYNMPQYYSNIINTTYLLLCVSVSCYVVTQALHLQRTNEESNWIYLHFGSMLSDLCYNPSCSRDRSQINSILSGNWVLPEHCGHCTT